MILRQAQETSVCDLERRVLRRLGRVVRWQGERLVAELLAVRTRQAPEPAQRAWWRRTAGRWMETVAPVDGRRVWVAVQGEATARQARWAILEEGLQAALLRGVRLASAQMGVDLGFNAAHPRVMEYLEGQMPGLIAAIDEALWGAIAAILGAGQRDGWPWRRVEGALRRLYRDGLRGALAALVGQGLDQAYAAGRKMVGEVAPS